MTISSLTYWHSTLQGKSLPIHENDPQEGWYRTRPRKGYRSLPVKIWRDEGTGELLALRDGRRVDPYEVWTWVCLNPVSVEAYQDVLERGGRWPDDVGLGRKAETKTETGSGDHAAGLGRAIARRARNADAVRSSVKPLPRQIGHNSGAVDLRSDVFSRAAVAADPAVLNLGFDGGVEAKADTTSTSTTTTDLAQALSSELLDLHTEVLAWLSEVGVIADQVTADRCANYAEVFSDLEKKAEGFRTAEKKPVLDQGRAIDAQWKAIVSAADEVKRLCKKAVEPFLIAETERLEQELIEQLKAANGDLSGLSSMPIAAKAGSFGRTISLRRVRRLVVSDRTTLLNHYHRDPRFLNDEAVQKLLAKLAEHDLQAGLSVPGVESVEERVAA